MKSLQYLIPNHIAEAIGVTLMHSLWQFAALGLLLLLLLALIPQRAARLRYWLAVSTMGLMIAFPMATFGYVYEPPVAPVATASPAMSTMAAAYAYVQQASNIVRPPVSHSFSDQIITFFQANAYILLCAWLLGMTALSVRFAGSCWQVHRLRRQGVEDVPQELAARFVDLLDQLGIRRTVSLRYSKLVDTPMVIGALKPVVLLPLGLLSGLSMEQVECILIHELGHVRRWDYLLNVVQSILEIIFFYHPVTWWVSKVMRTERENCCDELVVNLKRSKVQYARALLNLEIMRQQTPSLALASQGGDLQSRIRRITGGVVPPRKFHARGLLFGLLTSACIFLLATQSHTMVKAALPYFVEDQAPVSPTGETEPQDYKTSPSVAASDEVNITSTATAATQWMAGLLSNLPIHFAVQDSPVTKISIIDDEDVLELRLNSAGNIVSGTHNGVAIPKDEFPKYEQRIASTLLQPAPVAPIAPLSPLAPMSPMDPMNPIAPMPPIPAIAPMPPMPAMNPMGQNGRDSKKFEQQMEQFGKQMEQWGKQFEGQEWQNYTREIEQWGEQFGRQFGMNVGQWAQGLQRISSADSVEVQELQNEIAELSKRLSEAKTEEERDEITAAIDEQASRLGEIQANAIESSMGDFEERISAWGEQFAESMERMAEAQEDAAARYEAEAERLEAEAEELGGRCEEEAERAVEASERIGDALVDDGIIKSSRSFKLKINEDELYVNGKEQPQVLHRRYLRMIKNELGFEVGEDWVTIAHNHR